MFDASVDLTLLFVASLLAATIVPAQSEALLAGLHMSGKYSTILLVAVASFGNILGACINWLLGRYIERFKNRRWFPVKPSALDKAATTFQRYGVWSLLFAWLPIIGDPLTVIAGTLRTPFALFLLLVSIGKLARYVAIVMAF